LIDTSLTAVFKGSHSEEVGRKNIPIVKREGSFLISKQNEILSRVLLLEPREKQFFVGS
jgi:hypothetical protein